MNDSTNCACEAGTTIPVTGLSLQCDLSGVLSDTPPGGEGPDFSLEEQWTGRRWIDGKKIWQKTIHTGALTNASGKLIPHDITDIGIVLSVQGQASRFESGRNLFINLPHIGSTSAAVCPYVVGDNINLVSIGNYLSCTDSYVTLRYTRTGG